MKYRIDIDRASRDWSSSKLLPGLILVGIGLLALFGNLGLDLFGNLFGALLFGALAYYLYREGRRTGRSGMRLAALPVAGLALAALLPGSTGGALFLALIGLASAFVWRSDQARWWAVIPAGTFASLAAVAGLGPLLGRAAGFVFLLGLAATFYALTRLRVEPQAWAIFPAGALAVLALLSLMGGGGWLLPLVLIVAGVALLGRGGLLKRAPQGTDRTPERTPERTAEGTQELVVAEPDALPSSSPAARGP